MIDGKNFFDQSVKNNSKTCDEWMNEWMKFFILHWLKIYTVKKLANNKRHGIRKPAYINQ